MLNKIISVIISRFFFEYETSASLDGFKKGIEKINFRKQLEGLENNVDKTREELDDYIKKVREECRPDDEEEKEDEIKLRKWCYKDLDGETHYRERVFDEGKWYSWDADILKNPFCQKVPEENEKKDVEEDDDENEEDEGEDEDEEEELKRTFREIIRKGTLKAQEEKKKENKEDE